MCQSNAMDGAPDSAVLEAIRNNPGDIVNRLQRLNTTTRPDIIMAAVEDAISEIIDLRSELATKE
ncbi:hypothetical protein [Thalassospira sp.]|uniref:hypothetical protein n=1 Tax=Thalassospira sp. TaxID=1912094 RepID=UPI001B29DB5D|nr:hypothetical protein [Thalassospira sp.]MBO6809250.1 hypothetical protein [Thalassospira sp.]MBO6841209.1 hypothetical protein [Thalassospira sp.]